MPESEVSKNFRLANTPKFLSGIEDDSRDESRIEQSNCLDSAVIIDQLQEEEKASCQEDQEEPVEGKCSKWKEESEEEMDEEPVDR